MPSPSKLHYVNVGAKGTFQKSGSFQSTPADVDAIFGRLGQMAAPRVVMYFHGGLVSEEGGMETAASVEDLFSKIHLEPIAIVWETGFSKTLRGNLTKIWSTDFFQAALKFAASHAAKRLHLTPGARGGSPGLSSKEIEEELNKNSPFEDLETADGGRGGTRFDDQMNESDAVLAIRTDIATSISADPTKAAVLTDPAKLELMDPEPRKKLTPEKGARGIPIMAAATQLAAIVWRVGRRYWTKRHHGFYPTVIEEILRQFYLGSVGAWIWKDMKEAAEGMWKTNAGLAGDVQHAGRYILERLATLAQAKPLALDLVGHSAGSIAICRMLEAAAAMQVHLPVRTIALLAPACTSSLLWTEIASQPARYQRFRMYTMSDQFECADMLVSRIYTRSLLYLVSGLFEDEPDAPIAGMERFLSGQKPFDGAVLEGVRNFLSGAGQDRLVLAKTSGGAIGMRSGAVHHGGFIEDHDTRASLAHLLG